MCSQFKDRGSPCKMDWFEKNGYRILDFAVGDCFAVLKVKNKSGGYQMLGMIHPDYHYDVDSIFGSKKTKLVERTLWVLDSITAENVAAFDCGGYMTIYCNKASEKLISIIPRRTTPSGLTHFYKQDGQWAFVAEEDYESVKADLPDLTFAIKYPFGQFETKSLALPDLSEVLDKIELEEEAKTHGEVLSSNTADSFLADEPLYCAVTKISDKDRRIYLKEKEVFDHSTP